MENGNTTISLKKETLDRLRTYGISGESAEDILIKLMNKYKGGI